MSLREDLVAAMKSALKQRDSETLGVIRLILAAVKQFDIDERVEADAATILTIMAKMLKQRRDSIKQYQDAQRTDLADIEAAEMKVIQGFMPEAAGTEEIANAVKAAIAGVNASSQRDMGQVMQVLRDKLNGRADMSVVSNLVKTALAN